MAADTHAITLTSSALTSKQPIPRMYTCDGIDISPPLAWQMISPQAKSLALIMEDPDAPGGTFYHWVLYNIPTDTKGFAAGINDFPKGVVIANNSWDRSQYNGPCAPHGTTHRYTIRLYALDRMLDVYTNIKTSALLNAMKPHIIQQGELLTTYKRP